MRLRWKTDVEATTLLWREMWDMAQDLTRRSRGWIAELGGPAGGDPVGARLVTVDVDWTSLGRTATSRRPVRADVRVLPIRDAVLDAVVGRAILHHVPEDLDRALTETRRSVKPGGFVLFQEPTAGNLVARLARKWLPTDLHDPHERPLPWDAYVGAIARHFESLQARPYFLLSYLLPHLVARLPSRQRRWGRVVTRLVFAYDQKFLAVLPGLRRHAAYVAILAHRPGAAGPSPNALGRPST